MSPTACTLDRFRRDGFIAEFVERRLPRIEKLRDLFGFGDRISDRPGRAAMVLAAPPKKRRRSRLMAHIDLFASLRLDLLLHADPVGDNCRDARAQGSGKNGFMRLRFILAKPTKDNNTTEGASAILPYPGVRTSPAVQPDDLGQELRCPHCARLLKVEEIVLDMSAESGPDSTG